MSDSRHTLSQSILQATQTYLALAETLKHKTSQMAVACPEDLPGCTKLLEHYLKVLQAGKNNAESLLTLLAALEDIVENSSAKLKRKKRFDDNDTTNYRDPLSVNSVVDYFLPETRNDEAVMSLLSGTSRDLYSANRWCGDPPLSHRQQCPPRNRIFDSVRECWKCKKGTTFLHHVTLNHHALPAYELVALNDTQKGSSRFLSISRDETWAVWEYDGIRATFQSSYGDQRTLDNHPFLYGETGKRHVDQLDTCARSGAIQLNDDRLLLLHDTHSGIIWNPLTNIAHHVSPVHTALGGDVDYEPVENILQLRNGNIMIFGDFTADDLYMYDSMGNFVDILRANLVNGNSGEMHNGVRVCGEMGSVYHGIELRNGNLLTFSSTDSMSLWNPNLSSNRQLKMINTPGALHRIVELNSGKVVIAFSNGPYQPNNDLYWVHPAANDGFRLHKVASGLGHCCNFVELGNGQMISGSEDGTMHVWDIEREQLIRRFEGHSRRINKLIKLQDGRVATASDDGAVHVWKMSHDVPVQSLRHGKSRVGDVIQLSNGDLVTSHQNGAVHIWKLVNE